VQAPAALTPPASSRVDIFRLRPGWPISMLLLGYPLWWVLGLTEPAMIVATIGMAVALARVKPIRVPPGFSLWLLFMIWVVIGVAVVMVNAPGAVSGGGASRYLTWGFRSFLYVKATVALLYIYNMRGRLTIMWYCRVFGWMFVVVVVGGLLGVLFPTFQFTSPAELLLPDRLAAVHFVATKIHPVAAELHVVSGHVQARTSAPFPFANVWGLNFACFLPFFIVSWFHKDAGWRRVAAPLVLAVAIVPVIFSLNRGLWSALLAAAFFVALHSALAGRLRQMVALVVAVGVVTLVVSFSPLRSTIDQRLNGEGPKSNVGRNNLISLSTTSMLTTSPVVGFGTTRNVQGSFTSIAGGATTDCPRCSPPALGTQGQFSLVTFTQGVGGAIFYFGFLLYHFIRNLWRRTALALAGMSVLLMHFVTSLVYGADNLAIFAILGAVALLARDQLEEKGRQTTGVSRASPTEPTLRGYALVIREHRVLITSAVVAGLLLSGLAIHRVGRTYAATASLLIPIDPPFPIAVERPTTLDNIAQFAKTRATEQAMQGAVGNRERVTVENLTATATPNSRILHLTYLASTPSIAKSAVTAASESVIAVRAARLADRKRITLAALKTRERSLTQALATIIHAGAINPETKRLLRYTYYERVIRDIKVGEDIALTERLNLDAGHSIAPVKIDIYRGSWDVLVASGLALGLLAGCAGVLLLETLSPRIRTKPHATSARGLPVIASGQPRALNVDGLVFLEHPIAVVGIGSQPHTLDVVSRIEDRITPDDRRRLRRRVLLVASHTERIRTVMHTRDSLRRTGAEVAGLIVVDRPSNKRQSVGG
jgi:hypothetical protein